jgi:hypothetical protein
VSGRQKFDWRIPCILILVCLSGCTLDRISAQQIQATGLWDELVVGESFGQTFVSSRDNLYRIDLSTATFDRVNTTPVIFYLKDSPEAATAIFSINIPGPQIQNERPTSIVFPPISNSEGRSFYLQIESQEASPGNAITVYANEQDQYPDGSAFRNGQIVSGDLAFSIYSLETFTFSSILHGLFSHAAQDLPFFLCYGILILVVCVGLFLPIRNLSWLKN